ncbi:MAG: TonB-dependent receptor [Bacteroidetes bacterium]|nr:TonB-dependent receptor [Bacteroidota bacterium]
MRLTYTAFLLLAFVSSASHAQTGSLRGVVTDARGNGLPMANVLVVGTARGAAADLEGRFEITGLAEGVYALNVSFLGYESRRVENVRVAEGVLSQITILLTESSIRLDDVKVVGDRDRRSFEDTRTSVKYLEAGTVRVLPGVGEDILRSVQSLPGVLAPSDFTAQLVIRGSGPDQNLIVMDDIEIFNPYRLYGFISMFNPETVTDVSVETGGFPAKYGDRLSAVLDVTNRSGSSDLPMQASINLSITNVNAVLEGGLPDWLPGTYILSARRTYYDLIAAPLARRTGAVGADVAFPNFSDLQAKVTFGPFGPHRFIVNGLTSRDAVNLVSGTERDRPDSLDWMNQTDHRVLGLAWHYTPGPNVFLKTIASYYQNSGDTEFFGSFLDPTLDRSQFEDGSWQGRSDYRLLSVDATTEYNFEKRSMKQEATWRTGRHVLEGGVGYDRLQTTFRWRSDVDPVLRAINQSRGISVLNGVDDVRTYDRINVYLQDRVSLTPWLTMKPGLRYDWYDLLGKGYISPRLSAAVRGDAVTTLRASTGIYYQSPGYEKVVDTQRPNSGLNDLDERYTRGLEAERAVHVVLGIDRWLTDDIRVSADVYQKRFSNLITPTVVSGSRYETSRLAAGDPRDPSSWQTPVLVAFDSLTSIPSNQANGLARGFEVLLEKKSMSRDDRISGWVSYAYATADRSERGVTVPFEFDQRHTLNLTGSYKVNAWLDIGTTWRYGSNFPFTPAAGVRPRIVTATINGAVQPVVATDASGKVIFDVDRGGPNAVNSARKPAYHRLDVRATARTNFWGADWAFYLDVINLYNRANVLNYSYFVREDLSLGVRETNMFPILPTIGVSVRF